MKKYISTFLAAAVLAVMIPVMAGSLSAQSTRYCDNVQESQYDYDQNGYKRPGVYRRHRNLINIAIGSGAGAVIGGLLGGKKWAAIGAAAGAGGAAVYTYKVRPKRDRYNGQY